MRRIGHRVDTTKSRRGATGTANNQFVRVTGQLFVPFGHDRQSSIVSGVANQDPAKQLLSVQVKQQFLVYACERILKRQGIADIFAGFVVPKAGYIDAHQFQFGGQIRACKFAITTAQVFGDNFCHFPARRDQPVGHATVKCALADREDVFVAGLQSVVDQNASAFTQLNS